MKRTTYIIFGMLLAGLVVMCGTVIYMSTLGVSDDDIFLNINGEKKTVQLPECKVLQLVADRDVIATRKNGSVKDIRMVLFSDAPLNFQPATDTNGTFSYASDMDKYMTINSIGDTVRIVFNFDKDKLEEKYKNLYWIQLRSEAMTLALPADVQRVVSNVEGQETTFRNFDCDTLSLSMRSRTNIEDSHFRALHVHAGEMNFNSGEVTNLHLYLDNVYRWNVNRDAFRIDTEYLYAHGNPRCSMEKGECRQIVWMPQSDKASLNIELKQAARVIAE